MHQDQTGGYKELECTI